MTSIASADVTRLAEALRESGRQSDANTQRVLVEAANYILAEMEVRVPVKSGNLRGSLGIRVEPGRVIIGPDENIAPYAKYVEEGTRPHVITPKSADGVLVFNIGGRKVFAKKVNHPGTKAHPFVKPAFEKWIDSLGPMVADANVKEIKDHA